MNAEFGNRIENTIKKIGGAGKACEAAGITYTTLTRWKDGTSDPKLSNIQAFAQAGGVSIDWLMYGTDSENYNDSYDDGDNDNSILTKPTSDDNEYSHIPFYDIQASAGIGLFTDGEIEPNKHLAFRKSWVQKKGLQANKLIALLTKGDSMQPTIQDGAVIVIDTTETHPADGKLYVVRIDQELYVKRIQKIPQGIKLISDNKTMYAPIDINWEDWTTDQLQICGQLIHISHDL